MGDLELVRTLYAYNEWADNLVLDAMSGAADGELLEERPISRGSIASDLHHVFQVQLNWNSILREKEFTRLPDLPAQDIAAALQSHADRAHAELRETTDWLTEELIAGIVSRQRGDETYTWPRWHILLHLANHGTQHRAEAGMALLAIGRSPGDLDLVDYLDREA